MSGPEVCVLKVDGTNCDEEMQHAFNVAGAEAQIVHMNQLREGDRRLEDFHILGLPGGFGYGDDIRAGKIQAVEMASYLRESIQEFVGRGNPILGVCNGFQVLVQAGLLPDGTLGNQTATLAPNQIGRFECRWVELDAVPSVSRFVQPEDFAELPFPVQTAHGEGRLFADGHKIDQLIRQGQVVLRYAQRDGTPAEGYPDNPSGSIDNIASITDPSGTILGLMPHPERSFGAFHPHRIRTPAARAAGLVIVNNIVNYAREM